MLEYYTMHHLAYSDNSTSVFYFTIHPDWHFPLGSDYVRVGCLTATWAWDALEFV